LIKNTIKILVLIIISILLNILSILLKSNFLDSFLINNLVLIQINLLAINTATTGIILTKLKELSATNGEFNFDKSYKALKNALTEQIILISLGVIGLILKDSKVLKELIIYPDPIFNSLLTSVFLYSLDTLRDTGNAIFLIIKKDKSDLK